MCIKFLRKAKKLIAEIDVSDFDDDAVLALQDEIVESFRILHRIEKAKMLSDDEEAKTL